MINEPAMERALKDSLPHCNEHRVFAMGNSLYAFMVDYKGIIYSCESLIPNAAQEEEITQKAIRQLIAQIPVIKNGDGHATS